jgi:type II secretory ATPase GspE/PulE/Tfp pilus assembly ATPase PilB-like protein
VDETKFNLIDPPTDAVGGGFEILDEVALCVRASGLAPDRVRELAGFARDRGQSIVEVLIERAGADEHVLLQGLAGLLELPFLESDVQRISDEVLTNISPAVAISHHVMPLEEVNGRLRVACADPFDWQRWDDLGCVLNRPLEKVLCPRPVIEKMLKANYGIGADTVERLLANRPDKDIKVVSRLSTDLSEEEAANEPTVVNLVNKILTEAIRANATDIHFEPYEDKYRVRYRIDGMLEDVSIPVSVKLLKLALVSRIKIMSNLDITEKRLPQDGRCQVSLGGQDYDLRLSILPGIYGEAVVIRLQTRQRVKLDLESLGFEAEEREKAGHLIGRPHGLMLVTGPTGSGKTTTLYTALNKINQPQTKIITVEDPVEYWMEDILQMQVHEAIGFTFARALRSMLRHDPDVMLVGEIRDRETADIAIRSALTGHLVFSTLHTNDAASAATRLVDIGIEPFLVASSVHGILAQRLVRKVCLHCRRELAVDTLTEFERRTLEDAGCLGKFSLWQGQGCEKCRFTGYRGRTAIGEVLIVTPEVRRVIQQREPAEYIKKVACEQGMRTLRESAFLAVEAGKTSLTEILRVTQEDA